MATIKDLEASTQEATEGPDKEDLDLVQLHMSQVKELEREYADLIHSKYGELTEDALHLQSALIVKWDDENLSLDKLIALKTRLTLSKCPDPPSAGKPKITGMKKNQPPESHRRLLQRTW